MNSYISPTKQLAREIREALENDPMTDDELFEFIVQEGIIDRQGRVICGKLFGAGANQETPADPETNGPPQQP
jgi:hypothetical protein